MACSPRCRHLHRASSASDPSLLGFSLISFYLFQGANPFVELPLQTVTAPPSLPSNLSLQSKPQVTLFTAVPLPAPPTVTTSEQPTVDSSIRSQILTGVYIDLFSPFSSPSRQILSANRLWEFLRNAKKPSANSSRTLSFLAFAIVFAYPSIYTWK